jgi:putative flippase GtrA
VLRRAVLFNGSAGLGFGVNAAVFSTAHRLVGLSPLESAVVATFAGAAASFLLSSRVVFVRRPVPADVDVLAAPGREPGRLPPLVPSSSAGWERS